MTPTTTPQDTLLRQAIHFWLQIKDTDITEHEAYMLTAIHLADNSSCISRHVGAVIVRNGMIIAAGVNGSPGISCKEQRLCIKDEFRERSWNYVKDRIQNDDQVLLDMTKRLIIPTILHEGKQLCVSHCAERSAIRSYLEGPRPHPFIEPLKEGPLAGTTLYATLFPCHLCAQEIIRTGISQIYYHDNYQTSLVSIKETAKLMEDMKRNGSVEKIQFLGTAQELIERYGMDIDGPSRKRIIRWKDSIG